jgi:hypothetical protein
MSSQPPISARARIQRQVRCMGREGGQAVTDKFEFDADVGRDFSRASDTAASARAPAKVCRARPERVRASEARPYNG